MNALWSRLWALLALLLAALAATPAAAAVEISFYSKEMGSSFPHAFVILEGAPDRGGPRIDEDYGFSAKAVTPAILMGRVGGQVITDHSDSYVKGSNRHFKVTLSDAEYDQVMATIARWRAHAQPSYDLNKQNCVHFVAEIAAAIGMRAEQPKKLMKKPRSFILSLVQANRDWLAARRAEVAETAG